MTRAFLLRLGAAAATVLALAGSTGYVASHAKNPSAPLQPPVARPSPTVAPQPTGRIQIAPGVRATALPSVTITHVS